MPTIKDVAKEAGVSIATVSYVMNGRHDMVSDKTRDHVFKTAIRMGYKANTIAQNLQSKRTKLLGYAWHSNPADQPNMVMDQFIYQLAQAAEAKNYHLLTFTHPTNDPIAVYEEIIRAGRVDGFVIAGTAENDPRIRYLMDKQFPFVSFGRANPKWDEHYHWIDTDGSAGVYQATEYLIQQGHKRIAFLGWPKDSLSGNHRLDGYVEAMHTHKLTIPANFIVHHEYNENAMVAVFEQWQQLTSDKHPTALIAVADYVAVAAMRTAERFGYEIGTTMAIIGFDDAPFVRYLQPGLTTLSQPLADIASQLVKMIDCLIKQETLQQTRYFLPPQLVIRGSTG